MLRHGPLILLVVLPLQLLAQNQALPPDQAVATMRLPEGFRATVFAAEPDVVQPMAFTFDDRGRLWVVECLSYPTWKEDGTGSDRVTIFEDTEGDGRHDKRTVFYDKGVNLSGIEVGFGGVWLTAVPNLIFIPDRNGDDVPDGEPQVLLDGWDLKAKHNVVGNLAWGPDGWLYGLNGINSNSRLGRPGTPDERRTAMNCGVWRYHPTRHQFEVVAHGTTNPWGLDWDERGQLFITNCVIKHLFHVVPGSHFVRMFGQDMNEHAYGLIESCADHQHWAGGPWTSSRGAHGAHGDAGGGHAHSGCMIYLGDNWPSDYRGSMFTCNIHGQRLNRDTLEPAGSSYVARHAADFAFWKDPFFRGIHVKYGPDGGVYVSDWSDDGECHDYHEHDCIKTNGRIYKITYGEPKPPAHGDLSKLADEDLVALHAHKNEWYARHARRILQERAVSRKLTAEGIRAIKSLVVEPAELRDRPRDLAAYRLRSLFTWHVTGQLDEETVLVLLRESPDENVRAHLALLATESRLPPDRLVERLAQVAAEDPSPFVRLHVASGAQRVPLAKRWPIARALLGKQNSNDPYLSLMTWYAIEPLVPQNTRQVLDALPQVGLPMLHQFLVRRLVAVYEAAGGDQGNAAWIMDELLRALPMSVDTLIGIRQAYQGRDRVTPPASWKWAYQRLSDLRPRTRRQPDIWTEARFLAVLFGDRDVIASLEDALLAVPGELEEKRRALQLLNTRRDPHFARRLIRLVERPEFAKIRPDAIRALAAYSDPDIPKILLSAYPDLTAEERQDAIQTLTARPVFAMALLNAIEASQIPRGDVSALVIRQLEALEDKEVIARLKEVWGEIRPPSADKAERIAALKRELTTEFLQTADVARGRLLFAKNCANCHHLFDDGSRIGPELTGSQRHNLDYVLDNVLDPSGIVPREYQVHILRLADGRVVQGVITHQTTHVLTVQTATELVHVPLSEIEARKESSVSMMPEGLFDRLASDEIRDLVAYLASPQQVPLPAERGR